MRALLGISSAAMDIVPDELTGTGAAAGIAAINSIGNLGGLAGPSLIGWIRTATGTFVAPMIALAATLIFGGVMALISSAPRAAPSKET